MSRDWTKTLWPASFKGVPFWVEHDGMPAGRRVAVHEFPHGDAGFPEDMGKHIGQYEFAAYLVGDTSDIDAAAVAAAINAPGYGTLVLPVDGPIANCICSAFKRNRSKDKMGFIGFDAHFFVNEIAGMAAQVTVPYLAQLAYNAIGNLSTASQSLVGSLQV